MPQSSQHIRRYDPSQSSIADADAAGGAEKVSAGGSSGGGGVGSSSQDFGRPAGVNIRDALLDQAAGASSVVALASPSMQTSSVLSSAVLPQVMQSLTPLGGSGSRSSKERVIEGISKNATNSFTSQDNLIFQAPQPQGQDQHQLLVQQLPVVVGDDIHSGHQRLQPDVLKEDGQVLHRDQGEGLQSSQQKQLQQQQKAASALAKYQDFLRQQQQQMPPPQSNQLIPSFANRCDAIMVSVSQQTSQPQLLAAEQPLSHVRSENTVPEGLLPVQQRCDSSRTTIHETLTPSSAANLDMTNAPALQTTLAQSPPPSRDDTLPLCSSPALSLSLSFNPSHFPTSPNGAQAPASPVVSRLPKVLPPGDGRAGFIVLPAAAHADATAAVSAAATVSIVAAGDDAVHNVRMSSGANSLSTAAQDKPPTSQRIVESNGSDAETQGSAAVDEGQEETLVIPETPTGTPIQTRSTRSEDFGASGSGSRRTRPQPMRLAHSTDAPRLNSSNKSSVCGDAIAQASTSSGKTRRFVLCCLLPRPFFLSKHSCSLLVSRRNVTYAKIVALPTQPAAPSGVASSRVSSRGRPIRPKVNFDSLPHQSNVDSPESAAKVSALRHSRIEKGTSAIIAGAANASTDELSGKGSGGQDSEDDAPMVPPILAPASRRAHAAVVVALAESPDQNASVKRARTLRNEVTQMQLDAMKFKQQQQHQQQQQHSERMFQSALLQAASNPALPSLQLSHMSFIVTNVSRCLPQLVLCCRPFQSRDELPFLHRVLQRKHCGHQQGPA